MLNEILIRLKKNQSIVDFNQHFNIVSMFYTIYTNYYYKIKTKQNIS